MSKNSRGKGLVSQEVSKRMPNLMPCTGLFAGERWSSSERLLPYQSDIWLVVVVGCDPAPRSDVSCGIGCCY